MRMLNRFAALFTAAAITVVALPVGIALNTAVYAEYSVDSYFYDQLTEEAKIFYNAMSRMDKDGVFKSGESFDLVAEGLLTSQKAEEYGPATLMSMYGAARDAFYADHADIFYVDFSYLTLRVTVDSSEKYHVYLGPGRSDSYYTEGFTDEKQIDAAIAEYETAIGNIVSDAQKVTVKEGDNRNAEMVKYVHDHLVDHTSYRLENRCTEGNAGFIRTAYGSVVKGEAVCEGYSRALKAVLDRLDIPCVLIYGVYMPKKDTPEEHMWCQVQLDGKWYAVDATMDDPANNNRKTQGIDGYENQDYLLVGSSFMDRQHYASGIMSPVEYEFVYPELSFDGYNVEVVGSYGGLTVKFKADGELEGDQAGIFYISYNGMGVAKSAEKNKYLLGKWSQYYERTDEWIISEWGYILPDIFDEFKDSDTEVRIPVIQQYVEFAVTDVPHNIDPQNPDTSFNGDTTAFSSYSGIIYNPSSTYVRPPYIKNITPGVSSMIDIVEYPPHHVTVEYDDVLQRSSEDVEPGILLTAKNALQYDAPCSAEKNAKVENFTWKGGNKIEFDFTPSSMWLDDSVLYNFNITGLVGARSGKVPNPFSYCTRFAMCPCAYRAYGYDWSLYAKPTLMDPFDLDVTTWETADEEKIAQELASRMVLVVTPPSDSQTKEMRDMIDEKVLDYQTYNINLTVCKSQVVKTGQKVRVHLGFPEGYGPNDAGVTFKAYHFKKDDQGKITDVEDIECFVTQYGLVILCDSFSPYAIVAVPADENTNTAKSAVLSVGEGGAVTGADSIFTLDKNDTKTFTVTAKDGYVIDSIILGGEDIEITDRKAMEVTVGYEDISGGIIDIRFVAEKVYNAEEERGETIVAAVPLYEDEKGESQQPPESGDGENQGGDDNADKDTDTDNTDSNTGNGNNSASEPSADYVTFSGYIVDADGKAMSGVIVEMHSEVQTTTTDSNGYFKFDKVEIGSHTIYVKTANGDILASKSFNIVKTASEKTSENDIVCAPDSALSLNITIDGDQMRFTDVNAGDSSQSDGENVPDTSNVINTALLYMMAASICIMAISICVKSKVFSKK